MKTFFPLIVLLMMLAGNALAQYVPMGMKYQAVARDIKGQVIADQDLQLKISLYTDTDRKTVAYTEIHKVITNALGLFTLTIGEGITFSGSFKEVPWSTADVWMEVAIQTDDETDFVIISNSKMLSVPYAFHAATAGELSGDTNGGSRGPGTGVPSEVWSLFGNSNANAIKSKLGTTDFNDLVIVTNNIERIRVTTAGNVAMANSLAVGQDLEVAGDVFLNTNRGETINNGDFTVENGSITHLTGRLIVDGETDLNDNLNVGGNTHLQGKLVVENVTVLKNTLWVDGATDLNSTLNVDDHAEFNSTLNVDGLTTISNTTQSNSVADGALVVDGGVGIAKNLYVGGSANFAGMASFGDQIEITDATQSNSTTEGALVVVGGVGIGKNLNVGGVLGIDASNTGFIAKFENADGGTGDGLEIKLGKTHPAWNGSNYLHLTSPGAEFFDDAIATIRGWIDGTEAFDPLDLLNFIPSAYIAGTACNLVNLLTTQLNESIGLPASIPGFQITPSITLFGGIDLEIDGLFDLGSIPPLVVPAVNFPTIEVIPAIPAIPICDDLPSFTLPVISFVDVTNSLTNDNQFISFKDKDNRELGSIRAEAVTDWQLNFFDGAYIVNILASVVGIDFVGGIVGAISEFTNIADAYNSIGVEYASGNGDYAEWLERINTNELISAGDIVAVQGGKITKDLSKAEQVMAVSHKPIMLGNTPEPGQESKGNKIAFMGQIPVKVQGPVAVGDYIVGNPATPGYGIAVHPSVITAEQVKLTVGRSWESNLNPGPKLINTVIGVDNGGFLKIIQDHQKQVTQMEDRLQNLEAKMDAIANGFQRAETETLALQKENAAKMEVFKVEQREMLDKRAAEKANRFNK